jgi:transposase
MSKPVERVEVITGIHRRRRYTAEEKVRLVEQTMQPGMTVSAVARLYGVAPSLLFQCIRCLRPTLHRNLLILPFAPLT